MSTFRHILAISVICVLFVGVAAGLRTVQALSTSQTAAVGDAMPTNDQAEPLQTDTTFFSTSTVVQAVEAAAAALPPAGSTSTLVVVPTPVVQSPIVPATPAEPPVQVVPADPVSASAYIVGDLQTGKIYLEKNQLSVLPFASMSKLITAIVATETYKPTEEITITPVAAALPADASGLHAGEQMTVQELLYPMLMNSSNVAAESLADHGNHAKFLESMMGYSWEIGMPGSFFADATGLSQYNAGTAKGFFAMAQYLYMHRPDILAITRTVQSSIASTTLHAAHTFTSIHPFVSDPRFMGGKTGHTDQALDTMLTIMNLKGHPVAIIVLHSDSAREQDTNLLINKVLPLI